MTMLDGVRVDREDEGSNQFEAILAIRRSIQKHRSVQAMLKGMLETRVIALPVQVSEAAQNVIKEAFEHERHAEVNATVDGLRRFMLRLIYRIEARGTENGPLTIRFAENEPPQQHGGDVAPKQDG